MDELVEQSADTACDSALVPDLLGGAAEIGPLLIAKSVALSIVLSLHSGGKIMESQRHAHTTQFHSRSQSINYRIFDSISP